MGMFGNAKRGNDAAQTKWREDMIATKATDPIQDEINKRVLLGMEELIRSGMYVPIDKYTNPFVPIHHESVTKAVAAYLRVPVGLVPENSVFHEAMTDAIRAFFTTERDRFVVTHNEPRNNEVSGKGY